MPTSDEQRERWLGLPVSQTLDSEVAKVHQTHVVPDVDESALEGLTVLAGHSTYAREVSAGRIPL